MKCFLCSTPIYVQTQQVFLDDIAEEKMGCCPCGAIFPIQNEQPCFPLTKTLPGGYYLLVNDNLIEIEGDRYKLEVTSDLYKVFFWDCHDGWVLIRMQPAISGGSLPEKINIAYDVFKNITAVPS